MNKKILALLLSVTFFVRSFDADGLGDSSGRDFLSGFLSGDGLGDSSGRDFLSGFLSGDDSDSLSSNLSRSISSPRKRKASRKKRKAREMSDSTSNNGNSAPAEKKRCGSGNLLTINVSGVVEDLKGEVAGLVFGVAKDLKEEIKGLKGKVTGLEGKVTGLEGEVAGLKGEIKGLKQLMERQSRSEEGVASAGGQSLMQLKSNVFCIVGALFSRLERQQLVIATQKRQQSVKKRRKKGSYQKPQRINGFMKEYRIERACARIVDDFIQEEGLTEKDAVKQAKVAYKQVLQQRAKALGQEEDTEEED